MYGGLSLVKFAKFDTDEIIKIKAGKLSRSYKGYKGTFAGFVYNCIEKRELPGFCYEENMIVEAGHDKTALTLIISGKRSGEELMGIMDIAMGNSSAFPVEKGKAQYSISIKGSGI